MMKKLQKGNLEDYLAEEVPSALRHMSRLKDLGDSEGFQEWFENLTTAEETEFSDRILELFPRYREPSGESIGIIETGCLVYIRDFEKILVETIEKYIAEDCQEWRERGKERGAFFAEGAETREEAYEVESNGRDFSPFEFTASAINKLPWSEEAWEAYDEGISEGIHSVVPEKGENR